LPPSLGVVGKIELAIEHHASGSAARAQDSIPFPALGTKAPDAVFRLKPGNLRIFDQYRINKRD
jgi:hypothetical protein